LTQIIVNALKSAMIHMEIRVLNKILITMLKKRIYLTLQKVHYEKN